jgi:hypothetical protein
MLKHVFYCLTSSSFAVESHMELVRIGGRYRLKGQLTSGSSRKSEALHHTSCI